MRKTIVVTGSSDGIGAAAAHQLHNTGHTVVVVGRSPQKTEAVARSMGADHFVADFTRLDEVRRLAAQLTVAYPRIDVLANNAGGVFGDRVKTEDGYEKTFQINHLAPFLLTQLLMDTLIESNATVIQTSSIASNLAPKLDVDDLNLDRNYDTIRAYGQAKLENILFTKELDRRYRSEGIAAVAFHPGNVASSFGSNTASPLMRFFTTNPVARALMLTTPEKGASQLVWLAGTKPGIEWKTGEYYIKRKPAKRVNAQARDAELAAALWDRSAQLLS